MKKVYLLALTAFLTITLHAQFITKSMSFGGLTRGYIVYVPANYTGTDAVPLLLNLHGLGDNMANFKLNGFKQVADTAGFIFVTPQAIIDPLLQSSAWNSGAGAFGIYPNQSVDDVAFLNALMDTLSVNYLIDQERIYSTGFSMGGFMTNRLACELNNRIAAIASVSGTIGSGITCLPNKAIPQLHFHGTGDQQVAYTNNTFGMDAEEAVSYWVANNESDQTPIIDSLPDTQNDGATFIKYDYLNGKNGTANRFIKVINGTHTWYYGATDIQYPVEIWRFLSQYKWYDNTGVEDVRENKVLSVYPNPASSGNIINVSANNTNYAIYNLTGTLVQQGRVEAASIKLNDLAKGIYYLHINNAVSKLIVQ
jgi:polyhydroxybutyrate depolymerase